MSTNIFLQYVFDQVSDFYKPIEFPAEYVHPAGTAYLALAFYDPETKMLTSKTEINYAEQRKKPGREESVQFCLDLLYKHPECNIRNKEFLEAMKRLALILQY